MLSYFTNPLPPKDLGVLLSNRELILFKDGLDTHLDMNPELVDQRGLYSTAQGNSIGHHYIWNLPCNISTGTGAITLKRGKMFVKTKYQNKIIEKQTD